MLACGSTYGARNASSDSCVNCSLACEAHEANQMTSGGHLAGLCANSLTYFSEMILCTLWDQRFCRAPRSLNISAKMSRCEMHNAIAGLFSSMLICDPFTSHTTIFQCRLLRRILKSTLVFPSSDYLNRNHSSSAVLQNV